MRKLTIFYALIFAGQFYVIYRAHIDATRTIVITTNEKGDGFGAQVHQVIANYIYAECNQKEFCYRPFGRMDHNYDNDPSFVQKKEQLLNFNDKFLTVDEANKKDCCIVSGNYISFLDASISKCAAPLQKIKHIFRANKNSENYFNNARFNIAVHIRRPVAHDEWSYGSDVPDNFYIKIIATLRKKYGIRHPLFHIYSTGKDENFNQYKAPDVVFHINEAIEDSYPQMVFADVLVACRSALSYTAGYLSDGTVYYISYRHAPLPHWISVEKLLSERDMHEL